ncbi:MAG: type 1 glutamine amidotransferase [Alphaproteobacteria bacterium]|nr:type 1 glutamine amidotransferase [Alphaproteobacteria bacterium]
MAKILIFNATPLAMETRLREAGSPSYEELLQGSIGRHFPRGTPIDYFSLRVADGERFPQGLGIADFDGVWISGSPFNVYRLDQPSVREQIDLAREIWTGGVPTFGSCWGLQLMTAALGGTVRLNPNGREIGVARRLWLTDSGRAAPMFRDKPPAFDALCTHEDEVETLPAGATVLASNDVSGVQAATIAKGRRSFWGVQYHPEFPFSTVAAIISTRVERHLDEGLARSPAEVAEVVADFRAIDAAPGRKDLAWKHGLGRDVLDPTARTIEFRNWFETQVQPFAARR